MLNCQEKNNQPSPKSFVWVLLIAKRAARERSLFRRKSVKKTRLKTRLLVASMARMKLHLVLARSMVERERKMRAGRENFAVKTPKPCTCQQKVFSNKIAGKPPLEAQADQQLQ